MGLGPALVWDMVEAALCVSTEDGDFGVLDEGVRGVSVVVRGVPGALTDRVVGWVLGAGERTPRPRAAGVLDIPSAASLLKLRARVVAGVGGGDTNATFLDTVASAIPLPLVSKS